MVTRSVDLDIAALGFVNRNNPPFHVEHRLADEVWRSSKSCSAKALFEFDQRLVGGLGCGSRHALFDVVPEEVVEGVKVWRISRQGNCFELQSLFGCFGFVGLESCRVVVLEESCTNPCLEHGGSEHF